MHTSTGCFLYFGSYLSEETRPLRRETLKKQNQIRVFQTEDDLWGRLKGQYELKFVLNIYFLYLSLNHANLISLNPR